MKKSRYSSSSAMKVPPITMYSTLSTECPSCFNYRQKKGIQVGGVGRNTMSGVHTLIVAPVQCGAWLGGMGCSVP